MSPVAAPHRTSHIERRLRSMFSLENRWRGVEVAGWAALAVGLLSVGLFTWATSGAAGTRPPPTLLYPYFAAASVFSTTCIWILLAARVGVRGELISPDEFALARRWAWCVLIVLTGLLSVGAGFAGPQGVNAVRNINEYLFRGWPHRAWAQQLGLPFTVASAFGNALALATLVYLGTLCNAIVLAATRRQGREPRGRTALRLRELAHLLQRYLVMASALAVTSTLALYLFFGVAEQIETARAPSPATHPAWTVQCHASGPLLGPLACDVVGRAGQKEQPGSKAAAYMALVCGLSFTGALFVLFSACSAALDDRLLRLARDAHVVEGDSFSVKDFHERYGLTERGASGAVLQTLALVAPALTGLLTLVTS